MEKVGRRVVIMMTDGQVRDVDKVAETDDRTRSYIIRKAVDEFLAKRKEWEL